MGNLAPIELVGATAWRRAVFTTYALSLSFFEAVVLDTLTRAGVKYSTILSDVEGVRAALSEQGARAIGRDYQVEPIAVHKGVFHAKIAALSTEDDHHLLIGSGNLTFGGWGGNLEVVEHLHPSFSADAFEDAAEFFELLGKHERARHEARKLCDDLSLDLRGAASHGPRNGQTRILHSLNSAIATKVAALADELGGATRLVAASPFWNGPALDSFCGALKLDEAFVHAHPGGVVRGRLGANWPTDAQRTVHAVELVLLDEPEKPRALHAKMYEILCTRGRIVLSGSANGTLAAITSNNNIEAVVARIEREPIVGWSFRSARPLESLAHAEDEVAEASCGILRAALVGDLVEGHVLEPRMKGSAKIYQVMTDGRVLLGEVALKEESHFSVVAPDLEVLLWRGRRLIIRVEQSPDRYAEGFVSISSYAEIRRRIGPMASRLFAILAGTETPADVALIMSWLHENPQFLATGSNASRGHGTAEKNVEPDITVAVRDLLDGRSHKPGAGENDPHSTGTGWKRFLDTVLSSLRTPRGPFVKPSGSEDDSDDDEEGGKPRNNTVNPAIEKSLRNFERLFDALLTPENSGEFAIRAFDLTQYVIDRLHPDFATAKSWLERLVRAFVQGGFPEERTNDVAGSILILDAVMSEDHRDAGLTRQRLLQCGVRVSGPLPDMSGVSGFSGALAPTVDFASRWQNLTQAISMPEQAAAYLRAMRSGVPSDEYPDLPNKAVDVWPTLRDAISDPEMRSEIIEVQQAVRSCPRCSVSLPSGDVADLADRRVAVCRNRCGRILIYTGL